MWTKTSERAGIIGGGRPPLWPSHDSRPRFPRQRGLRKRDEWHLCEPTTKNLDQLNPKRTMKMMYLPVGKELYLLHVHVRGLHPHIPETERRGRTATRK